MILYKYFPANLNSFKSLSVKGLWCHYPNKMNDPFECLAEMKNDLSQEQIQLLKDYVISRKGHPLKDIIYQTDSMINEFFFSARKDLIQKNAFCALSERYDDILMWSHYASSHTGFVVGFEFPELHSNYHFQKVRYINRLEDIDVIKIAKFIDGTDLDMSYMLSDISVKSPHWQKEEEWRIWRKESCYYIYEPEQVKELYIGINTDYDTQMLIVNNMSYFPGQVFRMEFNNNPIGLKY